MSIVVYKKITQIERLWKTLFEDNPNLTYYQSYEWNACLENRFHDLHMLKYRKCRIEYAVCNEELIAPLVVDRANKRISMVGHDESSDYLSFVHGEMTIDKLMLDIKEVLSYFPGYTFRLGKINEHFAMQEAMEKLVERDVICLEKHNAACVQVYTDYENTLYDNLGKNQRQNYRTALNRLGKDEHTYSTQTAFKEIDNQLSHELYKLYFQRRYDCDEKPNSKLGQIYSKLRYKLGISSFGDRLDVLSNYAKQRPVFLATMYIDGNLAAFCEGAYSNNRDRVCIARVATNPEYYKYSPGVVMLVNVIDGLKEEIRSFDLTRGTEKYKFDLNGVVHQNYSYQVKEKEV